MTENEALKLAKVWFEENTYGDEAVEVYEAIKEALAQPAPYMAVSTDRMSVDPHTGNVSIGTVAQPAPVQEPVGVAHLMQEGFTHCIWSEACVPVGTKFYTTPPAQRQWVGLTPEEREQHRDDWRSNIHDKEFRAIEAKLKEKNT
jgi:hypothetical protein